MIAPLLALAMMQTASPGDPGSVLYRNCQAAIREVDSTTGGVDADLRPAERCTDYIGGFADGLSATGCACFGKASKATMIRVYVNFMQARPTYMDEYEGIGFYLAMFQTYPCPKK